MRMLLGHTGCLLCTSPNVSTVLVLELSLPEVSSVIRRLEIFCVCAIKTSVLYVLIEFIFTKHPPYGSMLGVLVSIKVICTNVLKEELNLLMIHFIVCLSQFFLCSKCIQVDLGAFTFRLQVHSIWTPLLDKHINSAPYYLSSFLRSFIRKGPNKSTPQFVKGCLSTLLSVGRSAIFYSPSFSRISRHLTHFPTKLLTIVLHRMTQNPLLLISLMASSLPP